MKIFLSVDKIKMLTFKNVLLKEDISRKINYTYQFTPVEENTFQYRQGEAFELTFKFQWELLEYKREFEQKK